jgi:ribosomal RNA assembly protein
MLRIICDSYMRIVRLKKDFKQRLNVDIENKGKIIEISGDPQDEYISEKIIEAINLGFPIDTAFLLTEEEILFEKISIKSFSRSKDYERVRGRIIGKDGKTLKVLSDLSSCAIQLKGNEVGIIGPSNNIRAVEHAITSLIKGAKQANVYRYLEKHHPKKVEDLGLKE